jgi:hypothetical protein
VTNSAWHFYSLSSGIFAGIQFKGSKEVMLLNLPAGHGAIEGVVDHRSQRVDIETGSLIDYQPPAPNSDHEWDELSKRWKLKREVADRGDLSRAALARIAHLEAKVQPRAIREMQLTRPGAFKRLQDIDDEIVELRKQLGKG